MGPEGEAGAAPSLSTMQSWGFMHACIRRCVFWGGQVLLHAPSMSFMQTGHVLGRETILQGSTLQQLLKVSISLNIQPAGSQPAPLFYNTTICK